MSGRVRIDDAAIRQLLDSPDGPVARTLVQAGIAVEGEAKRLLSQQGTGQVYVRYRPRRVHQASAPGRPPATDLGALRASVGRELARDASGLVMRVGTGSKIGRYLELGTRTIRPRPFLRTALVNVAAQGSIR